MCLYPKLIRNKKYTSNEKNGGEIPPVKDKRVLTVPIGCGKCYECVKQKSREWQVRLLEEIKHDNKAHFVTFTLSPDGLREITEKIKGLTGYNLDNAVATYAMRRYLENWRKHNKKSVKHWAVTELGQKNTEHLHIHAIIWAEDKNEIIKHWKYGTTYIGYSMNESVINYIIKYVSKPDHLHKEYKPKVLTSKGIGSNYVKTQNAKLNVYRGKETKEAYISRTGHKMALPIYYRNKIYSEDERENLWLQRLDKQERWVWGEKVDIREEEETYYKTLKYYQTKNTRMGYGNDEIDWERKHYENSRRMIKQREKWIKGKK